MVVWVSVTSFFIRLYEDERIMFLQRKADESKVGMPTTPLIWSVMILWNLVPFFFDTLLCVHLLHLAWRGIRLSFQSIGLEILGRRKRRVSNGQTRKMCCKGWRESRKAPLGSEKTMERCWAEGKLRKEKRIGGKQWQPERKQHDRTEEPVIISQLFYCIIFSLRKFFFLKETNKEENYIKVA